MVDIVGDEGTKRVIWEEVTVRVIFSVQESTSNNYLCISWCHVLLYMWQAIISGQGFEAPENIRKPSLPNRHNRFCLSFHKQESGWRDCIECGKLIHCGCIVERHTYIINDVRGITCIGCLVDHFPEELKDLSAPSNVVDQSVINSDNLPGLQESGTFGKSYQGDELSSESPGENGTGPKANLLISDSSPKDIVEVATCKLSALVPLFEIVLSRGDVNPKIGRLIIPETYAQECFPVFPERRGTPMRIWDSECRLWKFMLRPMMVKKKQLTVLDGTRKCIRSMRWKSGDILKFFRKDPEGEIFIGLKKSSGAGSSTDQNQNPSSSQVP